MRINVFFLVSIFLCNFSISFSQNTKLDSLQNVLKTHTKRDTIRVNLLIQIANEVYQVNLDKAIKLNEESRILADSIGYIKGKAISLRTSGEFQIIKLNFTKARDYFEGSLKLYDFLSNKKGASICLGKIGITYSRERNHEQAMAYYTKSLLISKEIEDKVSISRTLGNIGIGYSQKEEYEKALGYYNQALEINEELDNKLNIAHNLNSIGIVYARQDNYPHALEYFLKSLVIKEELNDKRGIALPLHNIGNIYRMQGDNNKALDYLERSLSLVEEMNNTVAIAGMLNNLGEIYLIQGKIQKSLEYIEKAFIISQENNLKGLMSLSLHNLGDIEKRKKEYTLSLQYYKRALFIRLKTEDPLGASDSYIEISKAYYKKKEYNKALYNALEGQNLAKRIGNIGTLKGTNELLSKIYYDTKQYKKAYANQLEFKRASDSLFNKKNIQKIAQLEYEYAYKKRLDSAAERESSLKDEVNTIDTQLESSEQQKLWWIVGFFGLIVFLLFLYRNHRFKQLKTQAENNNLRFQALNMQMNPHFIYNSLSSIQQYVLGNDPNSAQQYLAQFSVLMRAILSACKKDVISLEKEVDIIKNYIELEKKRFGDAFDFEIINTIDDSSEIYLPPLLIQPLVENAIIHGVSSLKDRKGFISISFNMVHQELECVVEDNGIGIETSIKEKEQRIISHESIALKNIKERLKLLDKKNTQRLSIRPSNNTLHGTETRILIPVLV